MNQIRALHGLEPVHYGACRYDQSGAAGKRLFKPRLMGLLTRAFPDEPSAQCYTPAGAEGSRIEQPFGGGEGFHTDPAAQHAQLDQ